MMDRLCKRLINQQPAYIQTHDYPDHDAVGSAFGLRELLANQGITAHIIYKGEIQRDSLHEMINKLGIPIEAAGNYALDEESPIILVDGCKGNRNVTDLIGDEIAVIDHHQVNDPDDVPLIDIRPQLGACATLIHRYAEATHAKLSREAATALLIAINMDTGLLTRGVAPEDIRAYAKLYPLADIPLQTSILRNFLQAPDLALYRFAIDNLSIDRSIAFCFFPEGCPQNLLGILADFLLALREVDFVTLCARNGGVINFSIRSERPEWSASQTIQDLLAGIGFGGGHHEMAGGVIHDPEAFDPDTLHARLMGILSRD